MAAYWSGGDRAGGDERARRRRWRPGRAGQGRVVAAADVGAGDVDAGGQAGLPVHGGAAPRRRAQDGQHEPEELRLALYVVAIGGAAGTLGRGLGAALGLGEKVQGHAGAGADQLLDGQAVLLGLEAVELGVQHGPGLGLVRDQYAARVGRVGVELVLPGDALRVVHEGLAHPVQEGLAEAVQAARGPRPSSRTGPASAGAGPGRTRRGRRPRAG